MKGSDHLIEAIQVGLVGRVIVFTTTGEVRRYIGIGNLVLAAGDDPHPRYTVLLAGGEQDDVVDTDQIGLDPANNIRQVFLRPDRGVHDISPTCLPLAVALLSG